MEVASKRRGSLLWPLVFGCGMLLVSPARGQEASVVYSNPATGEVGVLAPGAGATGGWGRTAAPGTEADLILSGEIQPNVTDGAPALSNPDIAVGPDDILVVAGQHRIMRLPNPTASRTWRCDGPGGRSCVAKGPVSLPYTPPTPGTPEDPPPLTNLEALRAGVPTSEIYLEDWLGATILGEICDGGFDPRTCLVQFPTVRYDQLHGHFLVAFAVTDTGVRGTDVVVTAGRASTWVLLVSRGPSFVGPDGTAPAQVFTAPASPPAGLDADWYVYYGRRDSAGPGGFLSLNMYSTHPVPRPLSAPGRYASRYPESNCQVPVGSQPPRSESSPEVEETVCLFPTEVRLGLDGDSIILVSPVQNVNQIVPNSMAIPSNTIPFTTGRYAGNRVRVLSKHAIYNFGELTNGSWLDPGPYQGPVPYSGDVAAGLGIAAPAQTQFDLFRAADLPAYCAVFDFAADTCTTTFAGFSPRRYTLGLEVSPTGSGIDNPRPPAAPTTLSALFPLYFEPAHLRGRSQATFSNYPFGGMTSLVGSFSFGTIGSGGNLWVQPIVYRPDYRPALDQGDQTAIGIDGPRRQLVPDTVINPTQAPQAVECAALPCSSDGASDPPNLLYVGDSRPRRVVYREGHLYDARTGHPSSNIFGTSIISPSPNPSQPSPVLATTVYYDVVQTRYTSPVPPLPAIESSAVFTLPLVNPSLTFYTFWQNGHFFSPMFDVPADVQLSGASSPSSLLAFVEKLFVGTTSPRVLLPDPDEAGDVWPSLFGVREGLDKFDRFAHFLDPVSGRVINPLTPLAPTATTNVLSTRQGGATDPNGGGLWIYGAFADSRLAGVGQWATHAAYHPPSASRFDAYGQPVNFFADVCPEGQGDAVCLATPLYPHIQTARRLGLTEHLYGPDGGPLLPAADPAHGIPGTAISFEPGRRVTRAELAAFVVYAMMDRAAVQDYLAKTTGGGGNTFADVATGLVGVDPHGHPAVISEAQRAAIEIVARRGLLPGCTATQFCPFAFVTRGELAEVLVRAKLANVHPTVVAGCPPPADPASCVAAGDNFWPLVEPEPFFPADVPGAHPLFGYVQTARALGILDGTGRGRFSPASAVSRGQLTLAVLRAFQF